MTDLTPLWDKLTVAAHRAGMTRDAFRDLAEKEFISCVLAHSKGNQCRAARYLGLHRNTVSRRFDELGIDPRMFRSGWRPRRTA